VHLPAKPPAKETTASIKDAEQYVAGQLKPLKSSRNAIRSRR
jgi:hypothetical protein